MSSRFHTILIGIDRYQASTASEEYFDLQGAVLDTERWRRFLHSRGIVPARQHQLMAPLTGDSSGQDWPSYDRIVDTFNQLEKDAQEGDDLLLVFSGHGGRVPTLLPELKGQDGFDEALIAAADNGSGETQVLRDVELAVLLHRWVGRGLRVTLCLDCCHAGGLMREPRVRGIGTDLTPRMRMSRVADRQTLLATWRSLERRHRTLVPASGWLPDPRGYVLFAACQAHERAYEGYFDSEGPGGVLTHTLLQALRRAPDGSTCTQLYKRLLEQTRQLTDAQNPQLEGDRDRPFWRSDHRDSATRTEVAPSTPRVETLLERGDPGHYLRGQLVMSVHSVPAPFDPRHADHAALRQALSNSPGWTAPIPDGTWICLKLLNNSRQALFLSLYTRLLSGGRKKLYPAAGVGEAEALDGGHWQLLPLRPRLPAGHDSMTETVEAIAATHPDLFRESPTPLSPEELSPEGVFWTVTQLQLPVVKISEGERR